MDVRVRGVYATALTKLLMDCGFRIVQPSEPVRERLGIEAILETPDVDVDDRPDRQGVWAHGNREAVEALRHVFREQLDDAILRPQRVNLHSIYKGRVVDAEKRLIDIGGCWGILSKEDHCQLERDAELLVQVKAAPPQHRHPVLSTSLSLASKYVVVVEERGVWVSRKITQPEARNRLLELGRKTAPDGLGIIWRPSAIGKQDEELVDEVGRLVEAWMNIMKEAVKAEAPCLLWEGYPVLDAEFPAPAKKRLDEIRSRVAPTLPNHHYYRACGGAISESLSLAEKLLEAGRPEEEVMQLFKEVIEREAPLNQRLQIIHVKLDGRIIRLGLAEVKERREDGCLRLVRAIKSRGVYDGLGTPREPTDLAITDVKPGSWYFCTTYLSSGGESKGVYININTPVELYPDKIRYVDLGVDVCVKPDGELKVLDLEEPVKAVEQGIISQKLLKRIESLVDELVSGIKEHGVQFVKEI